MIISINGIPGSGKTTVAKRIAETLNMKRYSMGDVFGRLAQKKGMTVGEFNEYCESTPDADHEVDAFQTELGKEEDNFVIDSRLGWHFIPGSFKIFLEVDLKEAAKRVYKIKDERTDEPDYETEQDLFIAMKNRLESDRKRYQSLYEIDYLDRSNYDLVVDTTHKTQEEVIESVLQAIPGQPLDE